MKRQVISKHDSRDLIAEIQRDTGAHLEVPNSAQVEVLEPDEESKFVIVDGKYAFIDNGAKDEAGAEGEAKKYLPFIGSSQVADLFPSVTIDDGALKYIIKGADVMRPGITKYDAWGEAGKLVVVREGKKGRAIAVGRATVPSSEMADLKKGNCVKNLHHLGDRFWNAYKKI
jgi:malignant T-cell-amplified sequence